MSKIGVAVEAAPFARFAVTEDGMIAALWFAKNDTAAIAEKLGLDEGFVAFRLAKIRDAGRL